MAEVETKERLNSGDLIQINGRTYDEDGKETPESVKKRSRKPPSEGKCVVCGLLKPLNRHKICYACFVKENLRRDGWKDGQPHPDTCGCEGLGQHKNKDGTDRGGN